MNIDEWLSSIGLSEYAPVFHANNIGMDTLGSLTSDDLKELGISSLGHRKKLLEEIQKLGAVTPSANAQAQKQSVATPAMVGGMWFDDNGSFYMISPSQDAIAPFVAVNGFIKRVGASRPAIASWITKNYPSDKTGLAKFWKNLGVVLMIEGPWCMAWCGVIYGNKPEIPALNKSLRQVKKGADALNWPLDATVSLVDMNNPSEAEECTWRQLLSRPAYSEGS